MTGNRFGEFLEEMDYVLIQWRDPSNDWPWFYLVDFRGEWIKLKGADSPDGTAKHDGNMFWVHQSEINFWEVIEK
jgi:hypothetical protein